MSNELNIKFGGMRSLDLKLSPLSDNNESYHVQSQPVSQGNSAYQVAVALGFVGTEEEWIQSLNGKDGESPAIGKNGNWWLGEMDTGVPASGSINVSVVQSGTGKSSVIVCDPSNEATSDYAYAEGECTASSGTAAHSEGIRSISSGVAAHSEGFLTIAKGNHSHVQGILNIQDDANKYAHIVGNGDFITESRSNAHTLDWDGNAWYAGTVEGSGVILRSSSSESSKTLKLTANDNGVISVFDAQTSKTYTLINDTDLSNVDCGTF